MARVWRWLRLVSAFLRLRQVDICEMSTGRGMWDDFHDWPDSDVTAPLHHYTHRCKHCGKEFWI